MESKKTVALKKGVEGVVKIGHGNYYREFDEKQQPFEISGSELPVVMSTGLFEEVNGQ